MNRKQRRASAKLREPRRYAPGASGAAAIPSGAAALFAAGVQYHQAGRLAEAEASYRRAVAVQPDHADAQFNLAVALKQQGKIEQAIDAYRGTIGIKADYPEAHYNLGNALMGQGKLDEAASAYRQALGIKPDHARAALNLGVALKDLGQLDAAVAAYRQTVGIIPNDAEAYVNLGNALVSQGKLDQAAAAYRQAISIKPDHPEAHSNLGTVLKEQGKLIEAIAAYRQAISSKPDYAQAYYNLGNALKDRGELDEAVTAYRQAISIAPDLLEAHSNLGNALSDQAKVDEAVAAYRQAICVSPDNAEAHYNLGNALRDQGKLDEAAGVYRRAIDLKADHAEAHANLGIVLMGQGKLDEALAAYRQAIAIKPDNAEFHSNLLFCLNYKANERTDCVFAAHREWDERFGRLPRPHGYANDRSAGRRLRIGYVSPDFRTHSVAYFVEPLLKGHDRQAVEVFCYAEVMRPDAVTARLQGLADHWLSTVGLSDDELAERIRKDGIDILVDLAGHTAYNRLQVFARKPAPVQVNWLGYPNTTGLGAIDYRLVDAVTDPAGEADATASEILLRLQGGFLCYDGSSCAREPTAPPLLTTGTVTFGSFNNPAKMSAATFDAWASLLARLPQARLLLKGKPFADAATRALCLARLHERGVAAERVELVAWVSSSAGHLALYDRIDIALDPFPYNGTTTTCEALWMGVPVVTLRGDRHAGRVGASLLSQIGLTEWIAGSAEDYVDIALALAENPGRLHNLRRSLRPRIAASPLCDGKAFAGKIEAAFRMMWRQWCEAPDDRARQ